MKSRFSEFSYGFALTHELIRNFLNPYLVAAPYFPSLVEEGKVGGGYDVELNFGYPLFLQFKLSDYLHRGNANERDCFGLPYYRFHLMPSARSNQHNSLVKLNKNNLVYYAAPLFWKINEINRIFSNSEIINNSVFFSPSNIGRIDENDHTRHKVVFVPYEDYGYFCSEPFQIKTYREGQIFETIARLEKRNQFKRIDEEFYSNILYELIRLVMQDEKSGLSSSLLDNFDLPQPQYIQFIAQTFFNCSFYIVGKK